MVMVMAVTSLNLSAYAAPVDTKEQESIKVLKQIYSKMSSQQQEKYVMILKRASSSIAFQFMKLMLEQCIHSIKPYFRHMVTYVKIKKFGGVASRTPFCNLLGFNLMPRIKSIGRQKLYRPEASSITSSLFNDFVIFDLFRSSSTITIKFPSNTFKRV